MTTTRTQNIPEIVPEGFSSLPEFLVFRELVQQGLQPGEDFIYQSRFFGFKILGAIEADFLVPPDLAINVQGVFVHYEKGVEQLARDKMNRAQLLGLGIRLIFIDEDDILENVSFYVREALRHRDHSRIGRGLV